MIHVFHLNQLGSNDCTILIFENIVNCAKVSLTQLVLTSVVILCYTTSASNSKYPLLKCIQMNCFKIVGVDVFQHRFWNNFPKPKNCLSEMFGG